EKEKEKEFLLDPIIQEIMAHLSAANLEELEKGEMFKGAIHRLEQGCEPKCGKKKVPARCRSACDKISHDMLDEILNKNTKGLKIERYKNNHKNNIKLDYIEVY